MGERALAHGRAPVVLRPGEGRVYPCGNVRAVFKADDDETDRGYSISEWWLEPHADGPGLHAHPEDDVFYVIAGIVTFTVGDEEVQGPVGTYVQASAGTPHDFRNDTDEPAGFLNVSVPGGFEGAMPGISDWFEARDRSTG